MPPGRGRGPGPGPGPGRGARVARRAARHHQAGGGAGGGGGGDEPPAPPDQAAAAPPPPEEKKSTGVECDFPRCEKVPSYGFADSPVAQFCEVHKDEGMVIKVADPETPKEETLKLVREYKELEAKLLDLEDAPGKAAAGEKEMKKLIADISHEESEIDKLTKAISELDVNLQKEKAKPVRRIQGPRAQDPAKVDKLTKDRETTVKKVGEMKGQKEVNEGRLKVVKDENDVLQKPAREYKEIHGKMMKLKADAVDAEPTAIYLANKAHGKKNDMKKESDVIFQRLLAKAA